MGQQLLNPDTVEGWHWGTEWIDSGSLFERVNFVSQQLGNLERPGVQAIVDRILAGGNGSIAPQVLVDRALDQLAMTAVSEQTHSALIEFVEERDQLIVDEEPDGQSPRERAANVLKMIGVTPEFQQA